MLIAMTALATEKANPTSDERRQILVNPNFSLPLVKGNPPGWFKAMMPHLTQGFKAGLDKDEKGPYLFLEQKGVKGKLFNNWAQRIEKPPIGQRMRLETEIATENAGGKGAVVLIMFFDKDGRIVGGVSSEKQYDFKGTKKWTKVKPKFQRNLILGLSGWG